MWPVIKWQGQESRGLGGGVIETVTSPRPAQSTKQHPVSGSPHNKYHHNKTTPHHLSSLLTAAGLSAALFAECKWEPLGELRLGLSCTYTYPASVIVTFHCQALLSCVLRCRTILYTPQHHRNTQAEYPHNESPQSWVSGCRCRWRCVIVTILYCVHCCCRPEP